jgi:predicted nucleic acid-binding Zn ribbon protein
MKKTTNTFLPLNDLLKNELGKIASGRIADTVALEQRWKSLVGDAVAGNAKVLYLKDGVLHVGVKNSTWLNELGFMRNDMLERVREAMPHAGIKDIRLKISMP